jgi:hypothetical protein
MKSAMDRLKDRAEVLLYRDAIGLIEADRQGLDWTVDRV